MQGDVREPGLQLQGGHGHGQGRIQVRGAEDLHEPDLPHPLHLSGTCTFWAAMYYKNMSSLLGTVWGEIIYEIQRWNLKVRVYFP